MRCSCTNRNQQCDSTEPGLPTETSVVGLFSINCPGTVRAINNHLPTQYHVMCRPGQINEGTNDMSAYIVSRTCQESVARIKDVYDTPAGAHLECYTYQSYDHLASYTSGWGADKAACARVVTRILGLLFRREGTAVCDASSPTWKPWLRGDICTNLDAGDCGAVVSNRKKSCRDFCYMLGLGCADGWSDDYYKCTKTTDDVGCDANGGLLDKVCVCRPDPTRGEGTTRRADPTRGSSL